MSEQRITEVLPEGDDQLWVTLDDGNTRRIGLRPLLALPSHRLLRLRRLCRAAQGSADGRFVCWPGGAFISARSVLNAPDGEHPLELLALLPASRRFRPLHALLHHSDPNLYGYLDVRPDHVVARQLELRPGDLQAVLSSHGPVSPELVMRRLSDLALVLKVWFPDCPVAALMRRPWPYAICRYPNDRRLDTALGCLRAGRVDLIEAPLLLLATGAPGS